MKPSCLIRPAFYLLYAILSLHLISIFLIGSNLGQDWVGHDVQPPANRLLVPTLTEALEAITPASFK